MNKFECTWRLPTKRTLHLAKLHSRDRFSFSSYLHCVHTHAQVKLDTSVSTRMTLMFITRCSINYILACSVYDCVRVGVQSQISLLRESERDGGRTNFQFEDKDLVVSYHQPLMYIK